EVVVLLQMLHIFGYYVSSAPRALHSFPTRRSSDLAAASPSPVRDRACSPGSAGPRRTRWCAGRAGTGCSRRRGRSGRAPARRPRSEEHTSELQSRENLVCRLLLEKKKKTYTAKSST